MSMLYLNPKQIKEIEGLFRQFIWGNCKAKISLTLLKKSKIHGGLRLVNVSAKQDALQINWIHKFLEDEFFRKCFCETLNIRLSFVEDI